MALVTVLPSAAELMAGAGDGKAFVGKKVWDILLSKFDTSSKLTTLLKSVIVSEAIDGEIAKKIADKIIGAFEGDNAALAAEPELEKEAVTADCYVLGGMMRPYYVAALKRTGPGEKSRASTESDMAAHYARLEKSLLGAIGVGLRCSVALYKIIETALKDGMLLEPTKLVPNTKVNFESGTDKGEIELGENGAIIRSGGLGKAEEQCRVSADTLNNQHIIWLQAVASGSTVMPASKVNPVAHTRHDGYGVVVVGGVEQIIGLGMADHLWWMGLNIRVTGVLTCKQYVAWLRVVYLAAADYLQRGYNWATAFRYAVRDNPFRHFQGSAITDDAATVVPPPEKRGEKGGGSHQQLAQESQRVRQLQQQVKDLKAANSEHKRKRPRFESADSNNAVQRELARAVRNPLGGGGPRHQQNQQQQQQLPAGNP